MSDIKVRKMPFQWPEDLPVLSNPEDIGESCDTVGFSLTMPHLEPYLIRTMRVASKEVTDPSVLADMKNFSAQEAQHHRNHSLVNKIVVNKLTPNVAEQVRALEAEMEADYQRFTQEKDLKFNLAYAEGFEAMTLAMALARFSNPRVGAHQEWSRLLKWHLAEEIEHRTVTFDAYEHLYGDYWYRLRVGVWAQKHFQSYVHRLARCVEQDFVEGKVQNKVRAFQTIKSRWKSGMFPLYLRSLAPGYDPATIELPQGIKDLWAQYDELAAPNDKSDKPANEKPANEKPANEKPAKEKPAKDQQ